jgi:hypothetical protein
MARDGANGGTLLAEDECNPELIGRTGGWVRPPDLRAGILEGVQARTGKAPNKDALPSCCGEVGFEGFGASPYFLGVVDRIGADL